MKTPPVDLVDIGANLTNKAFAQDLGDVLGRASSAGVSRILVTGTSTAISRRAREMVLERRGLPGPRLYATAGIHPHHASASSRQALLEIGELLARREVVAVGECGLDYERNLSPRQVQLRCFEEQLELAAAVKKPVFLHERGAHEDFTRILERHRPNLIGGVVHCFTGVRAALERYLALDMHVGFTGWLCDERRGTHLRPLARLVPEGRLLIETDAPYILPRDLPSASTHRRNEPAFLGHIAEAVATCRGESPSELARHTTRAAIALFDLSSP